MNGKSFQNEYDYIVGSSGAKRSKLESCVDILRVLDKHQPLKLTHVMHRSNLNCVKAKQFLSFLVEKELVEAIIVNAEGSMLYSITPLGARVREQFRELVEMLPIMENEKQTVDIFQPLQKAN